MISCQQYDYIEIACMYHFELELTLSSKEVIRAVAVDTLRNDKRQECLKVALGTEHQLVPLNDLMAIKALKSNPHFSVIEFDHTDN